MSTLPRRGSHSVFSIHLHLVFVTKYRRKVLTSAMLERMTDIKACVCRKAKSVLVEFNGESDHVHLLIDLHPDNNISSLIGSLKSASSRILRQEESEHLEKPYWSKPVFWSGAYYVASSGGAPIEKIKEYIQSQATPD